MIFINISVLQVHLGRDQWLSLVTYNSVVCSSRSPKIFVKNLAFAVFGHDTLKGSSVTGGKCNSKQNSVPKPSLDSTKLLAIKGILIIYIVQIIAYLILT